MKIVNQIVFGGWVCIQQLTNSLRIPLLLSTCALMISCGINPKFIETQNGHLVFVDGSYKRGGPSWTGGADAENKIHGAGTLVFPAGQGWPAIVKTGVAQHGVTSNMKRSKARRDLGAFNFLHGIDNVKPETLIKGGLALGGAAALANQGADSSTIGQYADNVMNERIPSAGGGSNSASAGSGGSVYGRTFIMTPKHANCFGSAVSGIKNLTVHNASDVSINGITSSEQSERVTQSGKSVSVVLVERVGAGTAVHRFNFTFTGSSSGTYSYSNNATSKVCRGSFITR